MTKRLFITILISTILLGCNNEQTNVSQTKENVEITPPSQYKKNTGQFYYDTTYPFGMAQKIELISYPDRIMWDTIPNKEGGVFINDILIKKGKLNFDIGQIKDRITLNKEQSKDLFNILYNTDCGSDVMAAACYDPRHLIVFYDQNNKAYSYIEICLECYLTRQPERVNSKVGDFCTDKIGDLIELFEKIGIKYGLKETDE